MSPRRLSPDPVLPPDPTPSPAEVAAARMHVDAVAANIRRRRARLDLTVDDVAERAGLSAGLVSQLERGKGNPSLATLARLAAALGLRLPELVEPAISDHGALVPAGARTVLPPMPENPELRRELLTPGMNVPLQVIRTEMPPRASNEDRPFRHLGTETVHVIEGRIAVTVGDTRYELAVGDTLTYDCAEPHWWDNPSDEPAVILGATVPLSR